jgi:hypothetical protein
MPEFRIKVTKEGRKEFETTVRAQCAYEALKDFQGSKHCKRGRTISINRILCLESRRKQISAELDKTLKESKNKRKEIQKWLVKK